MFTKVASKINSIYGFKGKNKPVYDIISKWLDILLSLISLAFTSLKTADVVFSGEDVR